MTTHDHDGGRSAPPPVKDPDNVIPALRTFVVRRIKPTSHDKPEIEEITVQAHMIQMEAPAIIWFTDVMIDAQRGAITDVHRVFFDVVDVEEVLRAPQGVILSH